MLKQLINSITKKTDFSFNDVPLRYLPKMIYMVYRLTKTLRNRSYIVCSKLLTKYIFLYLSQLQYSTAIQEYKLF